MLLLRSKAQQTTFANFRKRQGSPFHKIKRMYSFILPPPPPKENDNLTLLVTLLQNLGAVIENPVFFLLKTFSV